MKSLTITRFDCARETSGLTRGVDRSITAILLEPMKREFAPSPLPVRTMHLDIQRASAH